MGEAYRQALIADLMESARAIVREAQLPHIARKLDMSPGMLQEYLAGAQEKVVPQNAVAFTDWLRRAKSLTDPDAKAFVGFIVGGLAYLPEQKRVPAVVAFLRELSVHYVAATGGAPEWVQQLLALCPE